MLFNSLEFALFFPVVFALYFLMPHRMRTMLLLVASCVFYMAFIPVYILILLLTIVIDYAAGIYLERTEGSARKWILWTSIIATCLILFVFKYYNFFTGSFVGIATYFGWQVTNPSLNIILPIGLSFHTFQSLSYVVEVYRGNQKAEHNFTVYATYVMFFPQLVAGPIERPQALLHQFHEHHTFDYERVTSGLKRMAWGFFKKLVVADRLALYVNDVYASPQSHSGIQLTIATFFFAYQIYCDFSGYSDIAIGSARTLGFTLMENFDRPYHSSSVGEFWRRWHISLSGWFRDYVYVPMGGSRVSGIKWVRNILVTFGISGLWHGANWNYVVWGLLNGVYLLVGGFIARAFGKALARDPSPSAAKLRRAGNIALTFLLTCIAWTIFRAQNLSDAIYILQHLHVNWDTSTIKTAHFHFRHFPAAVFAIVSLELVEYLRVRPQLRPKWRAAPMPLRWLGYASVVFVTILLGVFHSEQFIYFQF